LCFGSDLSPDQAELTDKSPHVLTVRRSRERASCMIQCLCACRLCSRAAHPHRTTPYFWHVIQPQPCLELIMRCSRLIIESLAKKSRIAELQKMRIVIAQLCRAVTGVFRWMLTLVSSTGNGTCVNRVSLLCYGKLRSISPTVDEARNPALRTPLLGYLQSKILYHLSCRWKASSCPLVCIKNKLIFLLWAELLLVA
jgi:hypothetical protein